MSRAEYFERLVDLVEQACNDEALEEPTTADLTELQTAIRNAQSQIKHGRINEAIRIIQEAIDDIHSLLENWDISDTHPAPQAQQSRRRALQNVRARLRAVLRILEASLETTDVVQRSAQSRLANDLLDEASQQLVLAL